MRSPTPVPTSGLEKRAFSHPAAPPPVISLANEGDTVVTAFE